MPSSSLRSWPRSVVVVDAFYLHMAEGRADNQRSKNESAGWSRTTRDSLPTVLIHGTALTRQQLGQVKDADAELVWSPQSNLRL
jgi:5-methylthioadenosine/S-adenosylhomocysteine deaminase